MVRHTTAVQSNLVPLHRAARQIRAASAAVPAADSVPAVIGHKVAARIGMVVTPSHAPGQSRRSDAFAAEEGYPVWYITS
jgi:hypothetical protein